MKRLFKKRQLFILSLAVFALVVVVFLNSYRRIVRDFNDSAAAKQVDFCGRISSDILFAESITVMGTQYFKNGGNLINSDNFDFLEYDSASNEYNMDSAKDSANAKKLGNLTGIGQIPQSGVAKQELNLALSFNNYFSDFYDKLPEITWMYYTSESGFINMYPWISSEEFKYSEELKTMPFYSIATPQNNPLHKIAWTHTYIDAAGKGLMVTLSCPIYSGDTFKGVLSLDFTCTELNRMLDNNYSGLLYDQDYCVISADVLKSSEELPYLNKNYGFSVSELSDLESAAFDKVQTAGSLFVYKSTVENTPWTLLFTIPKTYVVGKALLNTLPEIAIGLLLIYSFILLMRFKKAERQLKEASITDPLTGLKNRWYLDDAAEREIALADRNAQALSIISLDLDRFKNVNDTWGHPIGDEVLKITAGILKQFARQSDILVRLGGEEFAALLPQTDNAEAYKIAERIRSQMERTKHPIAGAVTASFGVAERQPGESYGSLYRRVDEALYSAKDLGRNRVVSNEEKKADLSVHVKIEWNPAWECGEATIDSQHRRMLEIANELLGMNNEKSDTFCEQMESLLSHISEHFSYEEQVQKDIGYPDAKSHAEKHKELTERAIQIKDDCLSGKIKMVSLISYIISDVINLHLLEEDTKFFPYIKKLP
ncbi:MAG: diguanylate cyclase [Clostridia bacterium]|nr:diguanylate cyclase [Clostridia bacterium]